jgi:hypothetical protein
MQVRAHKNNLTSDDCNCDDKSSKESYLVYTIFIDVQLFLLYQVRSTHLSLNPRATAMSEEVQRYLFSRLIQIDRG